MPANRLYPDPEDRCVCCDGHGYQCRFHPARGWSYHACPGCLGMASAGVFILRYCRGQLQIEQSWQIRYFAIAVARAERWAQLARVYCRRVAAAGTQIRILFVPHEPDEPLEIVHAVDVWKHEPAPAA